MSVKDSALQKALQSLQSAVEGDPSNGVPGPSSSNEADTRSTEALASLKRIKHALIGNTSRKVELASRPDDIKRCDRITGIAYLIDASCIDTALPCCRIISFIAYDDTTASQSLNDIHHQAYLQAADVVAALAVRK